MEQPIKLYNLTNQTAYKLEIKMESKRFSLNKEDVLKWAKNTLTFLAPALIIFLTAIQSGVPIKEALYSIYLWGLNVAIDLLKKFVQEK